MMEGRWSHPERAVAPIDEALLNSEASLLLVLTFCRQQERTPWDVARLDASQPAADSIPSLSVGQLRA